MGKPKAKLAELSLKESNGGPGEKLSRSVVGEVLPPVQLPPELQKLSQDWKRLSHEQRLSDVKKRSQEERIRLLQSIGGVCRNAIQIVRDFRPLIEVCRKELSQRGRRVPVEGKPTWTEFVETTFGVKVRRMQQLLSEGEAPSAAPKHKPKTATPSPSRRSQGTDQLRELAISLAWAVIEEGLGDKFPGADKILKFVGEEHRNENSGEPTKRGGSRSATKSEPPQPPNSDKRPPEQIRISGLDIEPQPGCYICGTGIDTCDLHKAALKALMAERELDEVDASEFLRHEFAKSVKASAGRAR